ncbi:arginine deiminase family protein [Sphingomonas sp. BN140010]|uniref:Arginine deiminase family protein n=1 Tax=Sphingomonas arvum TaxID=2992113 RepID=A0ABT3JJA2_9SPHN|nr:arginine deiminase family protein [Sphingomonas sp. BN140010]MCW3798866.1 arginine deiminase family protein [Sphingomonas sp. BN140010]
MGVAFTRAVSPNFSNCELTHLGRAPIEPARAARQHQAYEQAIADAGLKVVRLPALDQHPDGVFVEDTAIILGEHAVITRPGAPSRRPEADNTADALSDRFTVHRLRRGRLDGGDVLRIGDKLYVGQSTRTDCAGIVALANIAGRLGHEVIEVPHDRCLHLKTGATHAGRDSAGRDVVLINPDWIDPGVFDDVFLLPTHPNEAFGANALRVGERLIYPSAYPHTAERLRALGFDVDEVDISELEKAEAGLTCMSLIAEEL